MAAFVDLLGDQLLTQTGPGKTEEVLEGKTAVGIFFSAHWCPPCRSFTPELTKWYERDLQAKGFEVVFVTSDKEEAAFDDYFDTMPWLAVPFQKANKRRQELCEKFQVTGLPTLLILDESGAVINRDGRAALAGDPRGEEFPWRPKTLGEILEGAPILGPGGAEVGWEALEGKVFGLYFSAQWCPPCRDFTPQLVEWYSKDLKEKGLEVLLVSSDQDQREFEGHFATMPWLAIHFADQKRRAQLSSLLQVTGLPALVIVDKDLSIITKNGCGVIGGDPTGADFPWYPKPVGNLEIDTVGINHVPTVIAFCESCSAETRAAVEQAMEPVAARLLAEAKAKGEELPKIAFTMAVTPGGIAGRLRTMMAMQSLPPAKHEHPLEYVPSQMGWGCDGCGRDGSLLVERYTCSLGCDFDYCVACNEKAGSADSLPPQLMLIDIPDKHGFSDGPSGEITTEVVEKLAKDYLADKLIRQQLRQ